MTYADKQKHLLNQLTHNLEFLSQSIEILHFSYDKCKTMNLTKEYSKNEFESLEALTTRFARTSDILTQKVFKSLFIILKENIKTVIDAANFLEKIEIIEKAEDILKIRELRNEISHEYSTVTLDEIFKKTLNYIPLLLEIVKNTKKYYKQNF